MSHPDIPIALPVLPVLFAEEPGLVLEVQEPDLAAVLKRYWDAGLQCLELGRTGLAGPHAVVSKYGGAVCGAELWAISASLRPR